MINTTTVATASTVIPTVPPTALTALHHRGENTVAVPLDPVEYRPVPAGDGGSVLDRVDHRGLAHEQHRTDAANDARRGAQQPDPP